MPPALIMSTLCRFAALPPTGIEVSLEHLNMLIRQGGPSALLEAVGTFLPATQARAYSEAISDLSASLSSEPLTPAWVRLVGPSGPSGVGQLLYNRDQSHLILPSKEYPLVLNMRPFPSEISLGTPIRVMESPFSYFQTEPDGRVSHLATGCPFPFSPTCLESGLRFYLSRSTPISQSLLFPALPEGRNLGMRDVQAQLDAFLASARGEKEQKIRQRIRKYAPAILKIMPGQEAHFWRHPARLASFALAFGMAKGRTIDVRPTDLFPFFLFLLQGFLENGDPDEPRLLSGDFLTNLSELARQYGRKRDYYAFFPKAAKNLVAFAKQRGADDSVSQSPLFRGDDDAAAVTFAQDILYFLAERRRHSVERVQPVLVLAIYKSIADGLHGPFVTDEEFCRKSERPIDRYATLMNYAARLLAARSDLMEAHAQDIARDFPEAMAFFRDQNEAVRWEEMESLRRRNLPPRPQATNPRLLLAGIGRDWAQVERYALFGYDLVLVDPDDQAASFYASRDRLLRQLETKYGVVIRFHKERMNSRKLGTLYEGRIDAIEYQHVASGFRRDTEIIDQVLKPGGVLTYFTPTPLQSVAIKIGYERMLSAGYERLLERENIPAVLDSPCEQNAYPLGNHLFVVKKP